MISAVSQRHNAVAPRLLHALLACGPACHTLEDLAEAAGVSLRSVSNFGRAFGPAALIARAPARLGPACGHALALSVAGDTATGMIVDPNGDVAHARSEHRPGLSEAPHLEIARLLTHLAWSVLREGQNDPSLCDDRGDVPLLGVGIAWPTAIDEHGRSAGRPGAGHHFNDRLPIGELVADPLGIPRGRRGAIKFLDSASASLISAVFDVSRAQAMSEKDRRSELLLGLRVGSTIDAASMRLPASGAGRLGYLDAQLLSNTARPSGGLGHVPVEPATVKDLDDRRLSLLEPLTSNRRCSCGAKGHLEVFAGASGLIERLRRSGIALTDGFSDDEALALAFHEASPTVDRACFDIGELLGLTLTAPIVLLAPDTVVVSGSLALPEVVSGIQSRLTTSLIDASLPRVVRLEGETNRFAPARGAALALLRDRLYRRFDDAVSPLNLRDATFTVTAPR